MRILAIAVVMLLTSSVSEGQALPADAEAHVFGNVNGAVAVGVLTSSVNIGTLTPGGELPGCAIAGFRIDANVQDLDIQICATDLYKGDSPLSPFKIDLDKPLGATVSNAGGAFNPTGGASNVLVFDNTPTGNLIHGLPEFCTPAIEFSAGTNGTFSEDVDVEVCYNSSDTELPQGEYSGWIKIIVVI